VRCKLITKIGIVAGEIWHFLDQHDQVTLTDLVKNIEQPRDMILMSLGWLAREGHVVLRTHERDYLLSLRREPQKAQ
jgi:hypothetical protein